MRITKAVLEQRNSKLLADNQALFNRNKILREQLEFYRKHSAPGIHASMTIALERVTDAVAHVVGDLKRR